MKQIYETRGFNIKSYHGGNYFDTQVIDTAILPGLIQICARDKHMHVIEWSIWEIKEWCIWICHTLTYTRYTRIMVIELVEGVIRWLNDFSLSKGFSDTMSLATIDIGKQNTDLNQKRVTFGSYGMLYISTKNTTNISRIPVIALKKSNDWGRHTFM